ncbi:hypothetical protein [Rubrolithibacter danxiaensis]|uniref:hypothetical protein n=1 Tax=Rubrolithibacter danxiaensis TaxID=3390805 RepID=UPI003BF7B922
MKHSGAIVERAVRRSGISIAELARQVDVNRRSLYNWFAQEKLSIDIICKIGFAIGYDFSIDFPEQLTSSKYAQLSRFLESMQQKEETNSASFWKNKYIALLEKYNEILMKTAAVDEKETAA